MRETLRAINGLKRKGLFKDYAIAGGYAVSYYIEPILTYDLDILILLEGDDDFAALYQHFKDHKLRMENIYVMIANMPVQFLPSYISPIFAEAISRAKRIKVEGQWTKILTVEYLIISLLLAFRPKDKMTIPHLLELADGKLLREIVAKYSNEKTPLHHRFRRILENLR